MTAKEANELASKIKESEFDKQYKEVKTAIAIAAKKGVFEIALNSYIKDLVVAKLVEEGYNVARTSIGQYDIESLVSWEKIA